MSFHPFAPTSGMLERVAASATPISLAEMNTEAALMTRLDQKYFVPRELLGELLAEYSGLRILEIGRERVHEYRSTYFDTPGFHFFRHHVQDRRHRNKVRIRTYATGDSFLEVKSKGGRGETVKERIALPGAPKLDAPALEFIEQQIPRMPGVAAELRPVLESHYDRATFLQGGNRITCDLDLQFISAGTAGRAERAEGPNEVLVETKSATGQSRIDRDLRSLGIRPVSVSKYGVGMCLLYPELPANKWHRVLQRYFRGGPQRAGSAPDQRLGRRNVQNLLSRNDTGVTTPIMMS